MLKIPAGALAADTVAPPGTRRLDAIRPYLQALTIFVGSRLMVALAVAFGKIYIPLGNDTWSAGPRWYHRLLRWDSEWY
ncbi:MAG: hypothetical protein NVS2B1_10450 [Bradyrhizobium sp.]